MIPVNIAYKDIDPSDAISTVISKKVQGLGKFSPNIIGCKVIVSSPHRSKKTGIIHHLSIHVEIPGDDIIVSREPETDGSHEDLQVVIRDAFKAVEQQLKIRIGQFDFFC